MSTTSSSLLAPSVSTGEHSYGDINQRTEKFALARLLKRGRETCFLDRFAQKITIPKNKSKKIVARRFKSLAAVTSALSEGVTPSAQTIQYDDVETTLAQYGGILKLTDVIEDLCEDPVLQQFSEISGEQAADTSELLNWNILTAGSTVFRAGGAASRKAVKLAPTKADFSKIERFFRRNKARFITRMLSASVKVSTEGIPACYVAVAHTDLKEVLEGMTGFVPIEKYGTGTPMQNEIGKIGSFRILLSSNFAPFADAGATGSVNYIDGATPSSSAPCDVYPIVCFGSDSFAITPLAGMESAEISVQNPGKKTKDDPLGQRGSVAWKMYHAGMVLNELWVARLECAAPGDSTATTTA